MGSLGQRGEGLEEYERRAAEAERRLDALEARFREAGTGDANDDFKLRVYNALMDLRTKLGKSRTHKRIAMQERDKVCTVACVLAHLVYDDDDCGGGGTWPRRLSRSETGLLLRWSDSTTGLNTSWRR